MVAALVFGTTDTGLAYSMRSYFETDELNIKLCYICSDDSAKTATCLLLDKEKKYVAFGNDAAIQYAKLAKNEKQNDYYFFDRFAMSLHNNENVTRDMVLKDKTGKPCSVVEVFTLSIKALFDCLTETIGVGEFCHDRVLWVLTVPSASTDSAKQLMRESAEKAGINQERLLLVTEPEAAFTFCHYKPTTRLHGSKPGHMIKEPGTISMVVDLGDMTADITVLQQTYNGQLEVLCRATGDDCGGTSVDDSLCNMLEEIVGKKVTTESKREHPMDWLDMLHDFRYKMKWFAKHIYLKYPCSLNDIGEEFHDKNLKSVIESSSYVNELTLCIDKFKFKVDLIIKLLTPTIDSIITLMKNTVSNLSTNGVSNNVSNIIMVGGLSDYHMIQDAVYRAFPDNQIIIPLKVDCSVLFGAVLFGHRPDYIWSELRDEEGIGK